MCGGEGNRMTPEINAIIKDGIKKLNANTRTEHEIKAIRLKLTLAIIDDILRNT